LQTRSPKGGRVAKPPGHIRRGRRRLVVYEPEPARQSRSQEGGEAARSRRTAAVRGRWLHPSWHYVYCSASSRAVARPARDGRGNHLWVRSGPAGANRPQSRP
jgi:hypothetical protein